MDIGDAVAVIGGGPAGLMAAEVLAEAGIAVDLFDAMPSVGRKFLLAGKGGLNLTHAERFESLHRARRELERDGILAECEVGTCHRRLDQRNDGRR